jgi:hypothetical protein
MKVYRGTDDDTCILETPAMWGSNMVVSGLGWGLEGGGRWEGGGQLQQHECERAGRARGVGGRGGGREREATPASGTGPALLPLASVCAIVWRSCDGMGGVHTRCAKLSPHTSSQDTPT